MTHGDFRNLKDSTSLLSLCKNRLGLMSNEMFDLNLPFTVKFGLQSHGLVWT